MGNGLDNRVIAIDRRLTILDVDLELDTTRGREYIQRIIRECAEFDGDIFLEFSQTERYSCKSIMNLILINS